MMAQISGLNSNFINFILLIILIISVLVLKALSSIDCAIGAVLVHDSMIVCMVVQALYDGTTEVQ